MKNTKIINSAIITLCLIGMGTILFASSNSKQNADNQLISQLSSEMIDIKRELNTLKSKEENTAVSMDPYIGQVILFAGNFAPRGWAFCEGQLFPISQYQALYSILGTTYGGDGRTTFALPDLRGRMPIGVGTGLGLDAISQGQKGGNYQATLTAGQLPNHNHKFTVPVYEANPRIPFEKQVIPGNNALISVKNEATNELDTKMNTNSTGQSQPFSIRDPYLGMRYIIALVGVYPPRS